MAETEAVYRYLGCYRDRGRPNRVLEIKAFTSEDMTSEQCMLTCLDRSTYKNPPSTFLLDTLMSFMTEKIKMRVTYNRPSSCTLTLWLKYFILYLNFMGD